MKHIKTILIMIQIWGISNSAISQKTKIKITINNKTELTAALVENSSTAALIDILKKSSLTITMHDYANMEKVGSLGTTLPQNDEHITTESGDLILYQRSAFVIYYAPNTWNFTRLGKIDNITQNELNKILGTGDVIVTLELFNTTNDVGEVESYKNSFRIYPNPAKDYIEIKGKFESISILDEAGKEVHFSNEKRINIRNLTSGIYFLKIKTLNNEIAHQKLLKI